MSPCHGDVTGSIPVLSAVEFVRGNGLIRYFQTSRFKTQNTDPLVYGLNVEKKRNQADVAQLVECVPSKYEVAGSSPVIRS